MSERSSIINANTNEVTSFDTITLNKLSGHHQMRVTVGSQRLARRSSLGINLIKPFGERSSEFKIPQT